MEELMAKYLANELNASERADFESQLIQNEQLRLDLESYANVLDITSTENNDIFDTDSAWNKVNELTKETKVVKIERSNFSFLKIAASLLVIAVAGYFIYNSTNLSSVDGTELASVPHGIKEFTLPDGSVVKLNANAKITLSKHFGDSNRNLVLKGEANFDVVRNEDMPFIIEAGNSTVRVLGTSFNLTTDSDEGVELDVTEGLVEFSSTVTGVKEQVAKGQSAKLDRSGKIIQKKDIKDSNFSGWWTRKLEYDDTPLSKVFEDLEKTYWVEIDYNEAIGACPLTTTFQGTSIEDVIKMIDATFPEIKLISFKENRIKLEGKACDH
ncbi:FecR domain-containing protein [uncultured Roseivirga sp.]|uniref:FecR family protein n=1 Tax=uncultured Roseivirga sp. TaxID=543088 RepID=UPI0030D8429E|tara:strand:- start:2494 stop:3471 length:978 start_codon:yes stop_codon:yes gene_type:complete